MLSVMVTQFHTIEGNLTTEGNLSYGDRIAIRSTYTMPATLIFGAIMA